MIPWTRDFHQTKQLLDMFGSPLYVYDASKIRQQAERYKHALQSVGEHAPKNFFAVKALPNPHILRLLAEKGMGFDCSSVAEIHLAQMAGASGEDILFTSNNTTDQEFDEAVKVGAIINFDDVSLVKRFLAKHTEPLPIVLCRYNPGDIEFHGINETIIGKPSQAKYGMPKDQIAEAFRLLRDSGVERFGLHTMLLSNELNYDNHLNIASLMFSLAKELHDTLQINFEIINLGGGFGVAYRPDEEEFDIEEYGQKLSSLYNSMNMQSVGSPQIITENGRWVTADAGYLLTQVISRKDTHKVYIGVDATMANLMRPGMYGAYHDIQILSEREQFNDQTTEKVDVVGSLCENNDKFAIDRQLPVTSIGDIVVINSAGAHGHAMGFQYNGKLRSAEVLLDEQATLIRRAETEKDLFSTLV